MSFINILARKFILKLARDPQADELLKKRLNTKQLQDPVFAKMLEHNVIPIITPRESAEELQDEEKEYESSYLGEGMYSKVYEVSYKGKLAVAKITRTFGDFDKMLKLDALKSKLGEDAKHLPIIYDTFLVKVPDYDDEMITKYIIIIEKLEPINSHLKAVLFNEGEYNTKTKFNIMKNNIDLLEVSHKLTEEMKHHGILMNLKSTISADQYNKLLESIDSIFRKGILSSNNLSDFRDKIGDLIEDLKNDVRNNFNLNQDQWIQFSYIMQSLPIHMKGILQITKTFPIFSVTEDSESAKHFQETLESKSFIKFLLRLQKEFKIRWGDLHLNNIMIRPSTGDLIVSDSGYFNGIN